MGLQQQCMLVVHSAHAVGQAASFRATQNVHLFPRSCICDCKGATFTTGSHSLAHTHSISASVVQMGILDKYNVELIGAKLPSINKAEDRELFKQAMVKIGLKTPPSGTISSWSEAIDVLDMIGKFPLIIRPAFTLGGTGGGIAYNMDEYQEIVNAGLNASVTNQVSVTALVCHALLCYAMLCCAMRCCAAPCCAVLCHAVLCHSVLCHAGSRAMMVICLVQRQHDYSLTTACWQSSNVSLTGSIA